jgi:L-threonylcarbamoyladenylate synthase
MIQETLATLRKKGTILYPTDTVWGIGGDATIAEVVKKIYSLKQREDHKALIVLVSSVEMLKFYVESIPEKAFSLIESERPTTVIYPKGIGFASNLLGADSSIGIRIPKNSFCIDLITEFGKPIVSTSANISGRPTPIEFNEIEPEILDGVDYVVPLEKNNSNPPSRIIRIDSKGEIHILRQ